MRLEEYAELQPHIEAYGLTWLTPNPHVAWRVNTLMTKEPDTVAWIDTMQPGEIFFDVGANIGQYSLLAAKRGVRVHAFEPESQNFALLCRNIAINKLGHLITPWPMALTDQSDFNTFHVTTLMPGGSCNTFGEAVNYHLQPKEFAFQQGCMGTRLDTLIYLCGKPNYIKIDVDGFEHKVLAGAPESLHVVKSVLVETNTHLPEHNAIAANLTEYGLLPDLATAESARRKDGPFEGVGNCIYYRNPDDFLSKKV